MMLYKNTKATVHLPEGNSDFFDIFVGVLQEDTIAPYLFLLFLDFVFRTSIDIIKENRFISLKKRQDADDIP